MPHLPTMAKSLRFRFRQTGRAQVTSSWDRTARLWTIEDGQLRPGPEFTGHKGPVNAAVFDADGGFVFTASADGAVRRFNAATGALSRATYKHGWGVNVLLRLAGGTIAFGGVDGAVGLLDGASGELYKKLAGHERPVLALASRNGRLATAGGDGVIRVWDQSSWAPIESFKNPLGPIWAIAFSGQAKSLYYAGLDDVIHEWQVTPRKPFELPQGKFPRRFQVTTNSDDPVERGRIQFARKCSVCHTLDSRRAQPRRANIVPGFWSQNRKFARIRILRAVDPPRYHLDPGDAVKVI